MKAFTTEHCTKEEVIHRCNELMFSKDNTELAIEFFIYKTRHSDIAERLGVETKSVTMRKARMKNILNSKN